MPTQWRPALLDPATLQLFFDLYDALPSSLSPMALSCLVQMAAVRRSLFDNAERAKFLNHVVTGVKRILQQNAQVYSSFPAVFQWHVILNFIHPSLIRLAASPIFPEFERTE